MRSLILSLAALTLLCGGCAVRRDTALLTVTGKQKPIVAILPVIDKAGQTSLPWDLSQELTNEIRGKAFNSKKMYLLKGEGTLAIAHALSTPDVRAISARAADKLGAAEFVVVTEVIEQDEGSLAAGSMQSIALRLRVLDVRKETPKVILQEVLDQNYVISRAFTGCDYEKTCWGTEAFNYTPMGMAHSRLVRELVARIESYVESAI